MSDFSRLQRAMENIFRERGIPIEVGKSAFAALIKALHETQFKAAHIDGSVTVQVDAALGGETAYHLAGMLSHGHEDAALEELNNLDPSLDRFRTTIERWEIEIQQEVEANK